MKLPLFFALVAVSVVSHYALAYVCKKVNGVPSIINYDLTTTLTAEQKQLGNTVQLEKSQDVNVQEVCPAGASTY
ncbi:fimbrial protein, partial [Salmonella enterica subsp. enterica serovar Infantis]